MQIPENAVWPVLGLTGVFMLLKSVLVLLTGYGSLTWGGGIHHVAECSDRVSTASFDMVLGLIFLGLAFLAKRYSK